jgi:hypothetical protein
MIPEWLTGSSFIVVGWQAAPFWGGLLYLTFCFTFCTFISKTMEWIPNEPDPQEIENISKYFDNENFLDELNDTGWRFTLFRMWSNRHGGKKPGLE